MDVIIRRAEPKDVAAIKAIYEQPHAYSETLQLPYPSVAMWQERFESNGPNHYNLVAECEGKVVGQLGLSTIDRPRLQHIAEFGMGVCATARKQGVGTKLLKAAIDLCDNWLQIKRIQLDVYTDNLAAINLYKKLGFTIEGEHKCYAYKNGTYVDIYSMARIKS